MQNSFSIKTSNGSYGVTIANNYMQSLPIENTITLIDSCLVSSLLLNGNCIVIEAVETAKDLTNIPNIITKLKEFGANRKTKLIGIGGGIIQDITCFVASIYMRGLEWIYLPTTALGMMDSCIGGKSSINVTGVKNLVGNFYPPTAIYINPKFLQTLERCAIISGLFEAIKICYATSNKSPAFTQLSSIVDEYLHSYNIDALGDAISISLEIKKWFIENDEFDKNERQLLNFGHTFGHAIESVVNYKIPHGIAVGIGILCAIEFAKLIDSSIDENRNILEVITKDMLVISKEYLGYLSHITFEEFFDKFQVDKKHSTQEFSVIVPISNNSFSLQNVLLNRNINTQAQLQEAFTKTMSEILLLLN
jgi:3-dehydroquinate synthase